MDHKAFQYPKQVSIKSQNRQTNRSVRFTGWSDITGKWFYLALLVAMINSSLSMGQISVSGLATKQIYTNSVTFTVNTESGYQYSALLDGIPVAVGFAVTVNTPDYHELLVQREPISTGDQEVLLVQFIIKASERFDTEWGLPVWTPLPLVHSASQEYADGHLQLVAPSVYPAGLEIPVAARVKDSVDQRLAVNGILTAENFSGSDIQLFRGSGSGFLPAATQSGSIDYQPSCGPLTAPKTIAIESETHWQTVSGAINTDSNWGEKARIHITGQLSVASGVTLTMGAGSVVTVDPDLEIMVWGKIVVNGTLADPVVFTAPDRSEPWGGFVFESGSQGDFTGTFFTASGADSSWFDNNSGRGSSHRHEQCLFYLGQNVELELTDCYVLETPGQLAHGENARLTLSDCLVQKMVTCGQYNGGQLTATNCEFIEFPSATAGFVDGDNDAFYLNGGPHTFTGCLIGWTLDDGIDAGQGAEGAVIVDNCWFESCYHEAMAWSSGPRYATVTDTVAMNCGQAIECGYDDPFIDADNCFFTANLVGARFGDNYARSFDGFLDVQNSLLLFNYRDVWGRAWDNWQLHLSQMEIQNNYLTRADENFPNNMVWAPIAHPDQAALLTSFKNTAGTLVGVGIAVGNNEIDLAGLSEVNTVPVRLSTFTTVPVAVNYAIYADASLLTRGLLNFIPGQTVQNIEFARPEDENLRQVRIVLTEPTNAELTGYSRIIYQKPYIIQKDLVVEGDDWRYFKGVSEPPSDWNELNFEPDSNWLSGPSGFGYETDSGYESCIATNLTDMKGKYLSVYARKLFRVGRPDQLSELILSMNWDDGYIAYINGEVVNSRYAPDPPSYDEPASTGNHEGCCGGSCTADRIDLSWFIERLAPGENVLAVQVHNTSYTSSDFLFIPELTAYARPLPGDVEPDGDVDISDLAIFSAAWLAAEGDPEFIPACDIDPDNPGLINLLDLNVLGTNWLDGAD